VYFKETLFEDALSLFERGGLDPVIFVGMFPEFEDLLNEEQKLHFDVSHACLGTVEDIGEF
jgi:hypothetical protein